MIEAERELRMSEMDHEREMRLRDQVETAAHLDRLNNADATAERIANESKLAAVKASNNSVSRERYELDREADRRTNAAVNEATNARVNQGRGRDEFLGLSVRTVATISTIVAGAAVAYAALTP